MIKVTFEETNMEMDCGAEFSVNGYPMRCRQKTSTIVHMPDGFYYFDGKIRPAPTYDCQLSICSSDRSKLEIRFRELLGDEFQIEETTSLKKRWEWDELSKEVQDLMVEQIAYFNRSARFNPNSELRIKVLSPEDRLVSPINNPTSPVRLKEAVFIKQRALSGVDRYIFSHIEAV